MFKLDLVVLKHAEALQKQGPFADYTLNACEIRFCHVQPSARPKCHSKRELVLVSYMLFIFAQ